MNIMQAIGRVDALKCNAYDVGEKIAWLGKLDMLIRRQLLQTHEGDPQKDFGPYTSDTPVDTELLAPAPFDEMYIPWLMAQMDLASGEYEGYNASILTFNAEFEAYENWYNRTHTPKAQGRFRF